MTRRGSSPTFVGRRKELDRLDAAFRRAELGEPSMVLVAGEAGVGKSRLVAEFATLVESTGARLLTGGCLDLSDGGVPYAPLVEAFRGLARGLQPGARDATFGPWADVLATLVPDLARPAAAGVVGVAGRGDPAISADPALRRARLFDAVIGVLGSLAAERPLVLVMEDIHWADGSTRDLVRFLVRNLRAERLLIVAIYRSDDLHRRHPLMPLLGELERADGVERIELHRFDRDELGEQLRGILGEAPAQSLVDTLFERSDGLPFYVEEIIAESGGDAVRLPSTLRNVLGLRLATLSAPALALVRAAAVIGGRFSHQLLAAAVGDDDDALLASLTEAIDARILVPVDDRGEPSYAFRHALLREAAYEDLLPTERVRMHARLADALESLLRSLATPDPSIVGEFALHAYRAHDLPRALEGSVRAARMLVDAVAFREALDHAERALELWPRVIDASARAGVPRADLLALAGRMAAAANRPEQALAWTQDALASLAEDADPNDRASLLADLQWYAWETGDFDLSAASAEMAYQLVAAGRPTALKAKVTLSLGGNRWSADRLGESAQLLDQAMAIAEEVGDRSVWTEAANLLGHTLVDMGQGHRAAAVLDRSSDAAPAGPWHVGRISSELDRSLAAQACGRFVEAERIATIGLEIARRYGWESRFGIYFRSCIADALLEQGRYLEASTIARPALEGAGLHLQGEWPSMTMARVAVAEGRFGDAHRFLDAASRVPTSRDRIFPVVAEVDLARAEARIQDVIDAVNPIAAELESREAVGLAWDLLGLGIGACADGSESARRRRRAGEAAALAAHAGRWLTTFRNLAARLRAEGGGGPLVEAILATAEAEMGRAEGAYDTVAWSQVAERWIALSHPYQSAYARLRLADAILRGQGDRAAAISAMREAHHVASTIGAAPLRRQIEVLALEARIRIVATETGDSEVPGAAASLTVRERDVMRLVAGGHTNREIGDRLFISEKTVSVHVSNAMAKLGALSRYEAAAAAERLGLLG